MTQTLSTQTQDTTTSTQERHDALRRRIELEARMLTGIRPGQPLTVWAQQLVDEGMAGELAREARILAQMAQDVADSDGAISPTDPCVHCGNPLEQCCRCFG